MLTTSIGIEELALRLFAALGLAFLLGLDREMRHKPMGLRTFMLVALGAATFSVVVLELFNTIAEEEHLAMDPARVIEGIVGGIGFLGAGAIIQGRGEVVGTTTGASIWVVGGIGMACGFGFYLHAILAAALAVAVLTGLGMVERRFLKTRDDRRKPEP